MICVYYGRPGSGKTTFAYSKLIELLRNKLLPWWNQIRACEKEATSTITNSVSGSGEVTKLGPEHFPKPDHVIKVFTTSFDTENISVDILEKYLVFDLSASQVAIDAYLEGVRFYRLDVGDSEGYPLFELAGRAIFRDHDLPFTDENSELYNLRHAIFFIDEVQSLYPKNCKRRLVIGTVGQTVDKRKAGGGVVIFDYVAILRLSLVDQNDKTDFVGKQISYEKEYHRHFGWDVICTCQEQSQVSKEFYTLVKISYHLTRYEYIPFTRKFFVRQKQYDSYIKRENLVATRYFTYRSAVPGWEFGGMTPLEVVHQSKDKKGLLKFLSLVILTGFLLGTFLFLRSCEKLEQMEDTRSSYKGTAPSPVAPSVSPPPPPPPPPPVNQAIVYQLSEGSGLPKFGFSEFGCYLRDLYILGGFLSCGGYMIIGDNILAKFQATFPGKSGEFYRPVGNPLTYADFASLGVRVALSPGYFTLSIRCAGTEEKIRQPYITLDQVNEFMQGNGDKAGYGDLEPNQGGVPSIVVK